MITKMSFLLITFSIAISIFPSIHSININVCKTLESSINASRSIEVPGYKMNTGENQTFDLTSNYDLSCKTEVLEVVISLTEEDNSTITVKGGKPNKHLERAKKLRSKAGTLFTPEGYLEYKDEYYNPDQYCISRISDTDLELKICSVDCENTLCLSKCCGIGEVVVFWNWTCKRIPEGNKSWSPFLYHSSSEKVSEQDIKSLNIHYTRPLLHCKEGNQSVEWEKWPFSTVQRPLAKGKPPETGLPLRVLKTGDIIFLHRTRRWKTIPKGQYCLDGFVNWGPGNGGKSIYTGEEAHQIILRCNEGIVDEHIADPMVADLYASVLFISSFFLFLTVFVHSALYDRQNIHGLCVLSQSLSLFCMYITHGTAYFVSQRRDPTEDNRSTKCLLIAILSHFFFLTTFSWLSVVNFDLWLTFRSMRPVSKMSKKMRRFRLYSLIGWGVPMIMMGIFIFLDFYYRDIESEVIVPDYGETSCFVASWARWHYNCSILAIVIPINLLMIASTFKIFYDFKKGDGPIMPKRAKSDKYSFKLFVKLFLVMGSIWCFELIFCWAYNNGKQAPWYLIVLDFAMFCQAIAIFLIFCWNRRTLKQLEEKYPRFKVAFGPIRRLLRIPEMVTDASETTPATPGGMRKMSSTSVVSQEGTIDRRQI